MRPVPRALALAVCLGAACSSSPRRRFVQLPTELSDALIFLIGQRDGQPVSIDGPLTDEGAFTLALQGQNDSIMVVGLRPQEISEVETLVGRTLGPEDVRLGLEKAACEDGELREEGTLLAPIPASSPVFELTDSDDAFRAADSSVLSSLSVRLDFPSLGCESGLPKSIAPIADRDPLFADGDVIAGQPRVLSGELGSGYFTIRRTVFLPDGRLAVATSRGLSLLNPGEPYLDEHGRTSLNDGDLNRLLPPETPVISSRRLTLRAIEGGLEWGRPDDFGFTLFFVPVRQDGFGEPRILRRFDLPEVRVLAFDEQERLIILHKDGLVSTATSTFAPLQTKRFINVPLEALTFTGDERAPHAATTNAGGVLVGDFFQAADGDDLQVFLLDAIRSLTGIDANPDGEETSLWTAGDSVILWSYLVGAEGWSEEAWRVPRLFDACSPYAPDACGFQSLTKIEHMVIDRESSRLFIAATQCPILYVRDLRTSCVGAYELPDLHGEVSHLAIYGRRLVVGGSEGSLLQLEL